MEEELIKYIDWMIQETQDQAYWKYHWKWSSAYKSRMSAIVQIKKYINKLKN